MNAVLPTTPSRASRDEGVVLPMVLIVSVVMAVVVVATATYTATVLRYGHVTESRANRLAAAEGAMDDAIEQLELKRSLCTTEASSSESGVTTEFPEQINGSTAVVSCSVISGALPAADGWAMVITGEGAPADSSPTLEFTLGGKPSIGGPVYVHDYQRSTFAQETTIVEGDFWYDDAACAGGTGTGTAYSRSPETITNLTFDPTTRGLYCLNQGWDDLFSGVPPVADMSALPVNPAPTTDGDCTVFVPGQYTVAPTFGNNSYLMSGNYLFDNLGPLRIEQQAVTVGQIDNLEGFPATDNQECDHVRLGDDNTGATVYLDGNTSISMGPNSSFEVSRRQQGTAKVGMHVLPTTTLSYDDPILSSDTGAQKEVAIHGLLWAPYSSVEFGTVPANKAAVVRGGAILARFEGGISNAADGFIIEVPTSEASSKLLLESTATDDRGSTTVRVIADYRPSSGELAVNSWRVVS